MARTCCVPMYRRGYKGNPGLSVTGKPSEVWNKRINKYEKITVKIKCYRYNIFYIFLPAM